MTEFKPRKKCIMCDKEIYIGGVLGRFKPRRGKNALTCSHKCSRLYTSIYHLLANRFIAERKKNQ